MRLRSGSGRSRRRRASTADLAETPSIPSTPRRPVPRRRSPSRRRAGLVSGGKQAAGRLLDRVAGVPPIYLGIAAAYVFVRVLAIIGVPAEGSFPDSATYRQSLGQPAYRFVSLTGHAMRPWVAPLLYAVLPSDNVRSDVQVILSVLAWLVLAGTVAFALRVHRVRVAAFVVVLALSCTAAVTSWDRTILSESTAISFAVLALAAWLRFAMKPSVWTSIAVVATMILWSFTKSGMYPVVFLAAVVVLLTLKSHRSRALRGAVAVALVLIGIWGLFANDRSNTEYEAYNNSQGLSQFAINFATLLRVQILNDPGDTAWFIAHGMPDPVGLPAYQRTSPVDDTWLAGEAAFLQAYSERSDLRAWVNTKGQRVYAEYVLTHARKVVARFSRELPYLLVPPRTELIYTSGPRDVLPSSVQSLLFDTTPAVQSSNAPIPSAAFGDVGVLFAACIVIAFIRKRRSRNRAFLLVSVATFFLSIVALGLGWILSPIEIVRHAIPASIVIRLSLWLTLFGLLDAVLRDPRNPRHDQHPIGRAEAGQPEPN
jgi:hypothetical protein